MTDLPRSLADLADEYVLGLLDPVEAREVEARLPTDPALAAAVARAEERFLPLGLTAPDAGTSPELWARIEAATAGPRREAEIVRMRPRPAPAAPAPTTTPPLRLDPLPERAPPGRGWRLTALASLAASALLAAGLGWQVLRQEPPRMVAVLLDAGGEPVVMVEAFADDTTHVTMLADVDLPPGKAMQLWTKPDPAGPPVSVGLIPEPRNRTLRGPDLPDPRTAQLYEITFEAETGSPTGKPTGPILGKGFAKLPR